MSSRDEFAAVPIHLSEAHLIAVNRRRRFVDQQDANLSHSLEPVEFDDALAFYFEHADLPESQIDSIWWDIGFGEDTYAVYKSAILPPLDHPRIGRWLEQGIDWPGRLVEECHKRNLEAFWSARVCPYDPRLPFGSPPDKPRSRSPLKEKHPDWTTPCWHWQGLWNLASAGYRHHRISVLREIAEKYDFDGFQLDFARHIPCLPVDRQWEHRDHATAFVRTLRLTLLELAEKKGHPILLAVKVPENLKGCRIDGFDVQRWADESLVDIFVLGGRTTTTSFDEFQRVVSGKPIKLGAFHDEHHCTDGYHRPPVENYRAIFGNWWAQGADFVGSFNWPSASTQALYEKSGYKNMISPHTQTIRQLVCELGSPDAYRKKDRLYAAERRLGYKWANGYHNRNPDRPLPCELPNHGVPVDVPVMIHESESANPALVRDVSIRLLMQNAYTVDTVNASLNGHALEHVSSLSDQEALDEFYASPPWGADSRERKPAQPNEHIVLMTYRGTPDMLVKGVNNLSLRATRGGQHGAIGESYDIRVDKAEILVRFKGE